MLRAARTSIYVGTTLPDDCTPTWHLPAAPIDKIARIVLNPNGDNAPPATRWTRQSDSFDIRRRQSRAGTAETATVVEAVFEVK